MSLPDAGNQLDAPRGGNANATTNEIENEIINSPNDGDETAHRDVLSCLSNAYMHFEHILREKLQQCDQIAKSKNEALRAKINTLQEDAVLYAKALEEKELVIRALKDCQRVEKHVSPDRSEGESRDGARHARRDDCTDENTSAEKDVISHSEYKVLKRKCEEQRQTIEWYKKQGAYYNTAIHRLKEERSTLRAKLGQSEKRAEDLGIGPDQLRRERGTHFFLTSQNMGAAGVTVEATDQNAVSSPSGIRLSAAGSNPVELPPREVSDRKLSDHSKTCKTSSRYLNKSLADTGNDLLDTCPQQQAITKDQESYNNERSNEPSEILSTNQVNGKLPGALKLIRSSQSTDDDEGDEEDSTNPAVVPEAGSDPVIVSHKILKRKRQPVAYQPRKRNDIITIKDEAGSSPISYEGLARLFDNNDSMDLNEFPGAVITPRKRKIYGPSTPRLGRLLYPEDLVRGTGDVPSNEGLPSEAIPTAQTVSHQRTGNPLASESVSLHQTADEVKLNQLNKTEIPKRRLRDDLLLESNSAILRSKSVNQRIFPNTNVRHTSKGPRRRKRSPPAISILSEDGDTYHNEPVGAKDTEPSEDTALSRDPNAQRLYDLLETPLADRQLPTPQPTIEGPQRLKNESPRRAQSAEARTQAAGSRLLSPVTAEQEPLRARPLNRLSLGDFKVNPTANHGYSYAFVEPIRGRAQRRCLPGCTRPECCGPQFAKLIALGGAQAPQRRMWDDSQTDPDTRLLAEHLGCAEDDPRIAGLSEERRAVLLNEARTAELANRFGRHRAAPYRRAQTPPGYWRSEFPSTQELAADRAESELRERQKVAERHREASKPNGLWKFRDE